MITFFDSRTFCDNYWLDVNQRNDSLHALLTNLFYVNSPGGEGGDSIKLFLIIFSGKLLQLLADPRARYRCDPLGPISFIFMQFSAKNLQK